MTKNGGVDEEAGEHDFEHYSQVHIHVAEKIENQGKYRTMVMFFKKRIVGSLTLILFGKCSSVWFCSRQHSPLASELSQRTMQFAPLFLNLVEPHNSKIFIHC